MQLEDMREYNRLGSMDDKEFEAIEALRVAVENARQAWRSRVDLDLRERLKR